MSCHIGYMKLHIRDCVAIFLLCLCPILFPEVKTRSFFLRLSLRVNVVSVSLSCLRVRHLEQSKPSLFLIRFLTETVCLFYFFNFLLYRYQLCLANFRLLKRDFLIYKSSPTFSVEHICYIYEHISTTLRNNTVSISRFMCSMQDEYWVIMLQVVLVRWLPVYYLPYICFCKPMNITLDH